MGKINVLDRHVADLIAAGEVVERPASVVKELIENSIDAGASAVAVEIQNGGITYIRVTDDGCGLSRDDAKTAFLRHATSKISEKDDLEHIATLGFRGEALAAIASVSKIDLITKDCASDTGFTLRIEGGRIIREGDAGCPDGTTIVVRELFYNTPARMKFLKKDASEAAAVEAVVQASAMSHPQVSVKLIRDGRDILHTPGDGELRSCIYALFGRDFANGMREIKLSERGIKVTGFSCAPIASRGNRAMQFFFVNGRPVRVKLLSAALDTAYKEKLMKGRFPTCVLMIELPLDRVDVNVHPAKTEVKFANERDVFDAVYFGVKSALDRDDTRPAAAPLSKPKPVIDTITENQTRLSDTPPKIPEKPFNFTEQPAIQFTAPVQAVEKKTAQPCASVIMREENAVIYDAQPKTKPQTQPEAVPTEKAAPDFRVIGEVLGTYIIVESGDAMLLIDKHAAHERILYEKLIASRGEIQTQVLLTPEIIELDRRGAAALIENSDEVRALGFEIDEFGDGCVAVSAVPDGIDAGDAAAVVETLAAALVSGARLRNPESLDEVMYSVACKAAIKAGQKNDIRELSELARQVLSGSDIRYCPHGRPVVIEYTKYQLERQFKRVT